LNELKGFEGRINSVKSQINKQEQTAAPYMAAVHDREYWVKLIDDINSRLPSDFIWVTHFHLEEAKDPRRPASSSSRNAPPPEEKKVALVLQGLYLENPRGANVVDDFLANLGESPFCTVTKESMKMRATPREEDWAFDFAIVVPLKNPISEPVTLITTK
jgi:Tfp pilus assembly protein PilN